MQYWILHGHQISVFADLIPSESSTCWKWNVSKQSMSSLVVKNDLYTYEITTLIQYCKSPNTPSLTLISYELWAKVGSNSDLRHYKTHVKKSPRQEAGTKKHVDAEVTPLKRVNNSPVFTPQQKLCWRSYGSFHQGNIGGFDLNFHQMELNINVFEQHMTNSALRHSTN